MTKVDPTVGPWLALVGAGPGDPDLLTRRAATLLGAADVVLHDWLVGTGVLALARPGARLIDVGKAKGRGSSQRHIEQLMIAHHGEGARVVRLKGGDPFVFGRGMEEVAAAAAAGIEVEVVPGLSSALAAPTRAGIAVTERGVSAQVTVVSGHRLGGDNDWTGLARSGGTIVVLMAATTGPAVAARLLDAGMAATTPLAVVVDATRDDELVVTGMLGRLATHVGPLPGPCVIVIGAVAAQARGQTTLDDLLATDSPGRR